MALELKLKQEYNSYVNFVFSDNTGIYSSSNIGGWGNPNISISDVRKARIRISYGGTILKDVDVTSVFQSATSNNSLIFTIPYSTDNNIIKDGVYTIEYLVSTLSNATWRSAINHTNTFYLSYNTGYWYEIQAKIFQRIARIPYHLKYCVKCDSFVIDTAKINLLLQSLISSAQYDYIEEFVNIYSSLEQILNFDDTWQIRK